ncbi:TetR/AcrR family transcriptional regulator [Roseibium algae]|uniref:Helix-turn-helix domain-containing protein n=1 Tax=Roseibium algae TaxID=3123038 RepID=A0ABU8TH70_9HYPH
MVPRKTHEDIVAAANALFYERGFEATSFADIAAELSISRGNFYYHFKTKDEILSAVIAKRIADREALLAHWEAAFAPPDAILRFIEILITNQSKIMAFGCPVGTLTTELAKLNHSAQVDANQLFTVFRVWLRQQFEALGFAERSDDLAMHLLMRSQGVATLATAYKDADFVRREVTDMSKWLEHQIQQLASE